MTLIEYVNGLNKFLLENPEAAPLQVVYSKDDEGNSFYPIHYGPTIGHIDGEDFTAADNIEDDIEDYPINAVCIN